MKKLFAVLLASLLVLSLTACGGKSDDSAGSDSAPADLNLEDVYQSLLDQQPKDADELVMLPESSPDILDGFYPGLSDLELKQQVFYAAPVTGFATEVMLVEVADSKDLDTVKEIFTQRIADASDESGCYPETAEIWASRAVVQTSGNYAAMIVLPDGYTIPDNVKLCFAAVRHILPDQRDAEECVSDAYLRAWNAIPPEQPTSLGAYLARITRNLALDRYDYQHAEKRSSDLTCAFEELEAVLPTAERAEDAADRLTLQQVLTDVLRAQTREARTYFIRRYWYGESISEIAAACRAGEGAVRVSLFRTRNRLRKALEKGGIAL